MEGAKHAARFTIEDNNVARRILEEAIAMCPENPVSYAQLGFVYLSDVRLGNTKSPGETLKTAKELAQKALAMDDSLPLPHLLLSDFYVIKREHDKAIAEAERAVALDPSGSAAYSTYARVLNFAGRSKEAIPLFQKAIRLSPNADAVTFIFYGVALRMTGRFEEAVSALKKGIQRAPDYIVAHLGLLTMYSLMGQDKEARAEAEEVLRINPMFSLDYHARTVLYFKDQSENDKVVNALRKAGLK
jgi:adenylate cyclase